MKTKKQRSAFYLYHNSGMVFLTLLFFAALVLAACGSDSGTGSGVAQAETVYGLGECEASNEGVIKLVTSENQYYKCVDGDWEVTEAPVQSSPSNDSSFVGGNTLTDPRDGQTYKTVKIGDQVWMAENLNYRYLGPTADEDSSSFCYNDDPANCTKYGRLYLWSAAMDSAGIIKGNTANGCGNGSECAPSGTIRGVCPKGWHVPSYDEWDNLFTAVGGSSVACEMLKSQTGWNSPSGIENTDTFGFSALPAGDRYDDGSYDYRGHVTTFWSSTESNSNDAYHMLLMSDRSDAYLYVVYKGYGFSVRCLKD